MGHFGESTQRTPSPRGGWLSRRALALLLLVAASSARAQTPHLVKDINGAFPQVENLTAVGATVFFTATGMGLGTELWRTDGTAAGTVLAKDIEVGPNSSFPRSLTAAGGTLYFLVNGSSGWTLWRSDGTPPGTIPLKDQAHGELADVGGVLFFVRGELGTGLELWRTDGTTVGTSFVSQIANGPTGVAPLNLTASEGSLYYTTSSPYALWRSDGTTAGTRKVSDLPGDASQLTNVDGILFFRGRDGELWRSDGTPAGTGVLWNGGVIDSQQAMVNVNGTLYFSADDGLHGFEPWRSDGTPAGTFMVMDVLPGSGSSFPWEFAEAGGVIFFTVSNSSTGSGLWKTDEDSLATSEVVAGTAYELTEFQGSIFFGADDGVNGLELWRSDGTTRGTVLVKDIEPGGEGSAPTQLTKAGAALIFTAGVFPFGDLWRSDGSAAGTSRVKNFIGPGDSRPSAVTAIGARAYFSADDRIHGPELWTSDGTAAGTFLVKDLSPGASGANPRFFTSSGGTVFFAAGSSLWRTNATAAGTTVVKDVGAVYLTDLDGTLLFKAYTAAPSEEGLWKSDGTEAGTVLVKPFAYGPYSSGSRLPTLNGVAFFTADDGVNGQELWRSDGTAAGTWMVRDIHPGPTHSSPFFFHTAAGLLFFIADDGMHGRELWRSDGTHAGTFLVKDIEPGAGGSEVTSLVEFSGRLYFSAFDSLHGWELWKTDGTEAGTMLVVDLEPGPSSSNPYNLTVVQGVLFFSHGTGSYLTDLSSSDGTAGGTTLLRAGIYASNLTPLGNKLYFRGCDPVWGCELWKSDGTPDGTVMVEDIRVGSESSSPDEFAAAGDRLFFVADNGVVGRELWTLRTSAPAVESLAVVPGSTTAQFSATVVSDGGSPIIERGFLVSATNPTPEDGGSDVTKVTVAGTTGSMAATLGGLSANTLYFLRAFARTANGVGYDQATFVTEPITGPSLSISDVTVAEGNAGTSDAVFSISLSSASSQTVTVQVEILDGSATAGNDYEALAPTVITFNPGVVMQTVTVKVYGDTLLEGAETFKVALSAPLNAILSDGTGTGVIVDDEPPSRVFISPSGLDANDCSTLTAPCRNIGGALSKVAVDGEVIVLSTGEYETAPLLITQGVKITAPIGVVAFIRQPITVNAPGARVALRGLHMKGSGSGDAVTMVSAGALSMEETTIDRWTNGLRIGGGSAGQVTILNSMFRQSGAGVRVDAGTASTLSVEGNRLEGNNTGIEAAGGSFFLRDTTFAGNGAAISAEQSAFDIQRSDFLTNQTGIAALTGGVVRMSRSFVFGNGVGLSTLGGGSILSSGTNVLRGNVTNTSGAIGTIPEQ